MRDIKFRAWVKGLNYMIHCTGDFTVTFGNEPFVEMWSGDGVVDTFRDIDMMQFTGLQDANGVDIYEGDLLRIPAKNKYEESTYNCFEVFYHDNECIGGYNVGFCMNRMHTQGNSAGGQGYKFTPESISKNGLEVIGNIHQNPELIAKGE